MAANDAVQLVVGRPEATREKLNLYDRFHEYQHAAKGWTHDGPASASDYVESFVDHPFPTEEWCYYREGRLIGVGYVDALPEAMSAIYFYYDPRQSATSSPGTFNVLSILRAAAARGIPHVYLGYYVDGLPLPRIQGAVSSKRSPFRGLVSGGSSNPECTGEE